MVGMKNKKNNYFAFFLVTVTMVVGICVIGKCVMNFLEYVFNINAYFVLMYDIFLLVVSYIITKRAMTSNRIKQWLYNSRKNDIQ